MVSKEEVKKEGLGPDVAVVSGSKSDEKIVGDVVKQLEVLGISYEVVVLSAHREPEKLEEFISKTSAKVFIAIAGLSAALPGFIASRTVRPVIGVPVSAKLGGLDALLSTVQMPKGVPVGCVGIDNGVNAALLAAKILALNDEKLRQKLEK
ncbi:MAG: 5-(carboxyamino)imidazole ribonucleotide mutase [Candidatus Wukongarchaeota archaeon]|nr:5-(carboxyamino)imidazole ribonucleotide mutase [Candidatus Wukongarchaeota archaeon]